MANMTKYFDLAQKYQNKVDFALVYTEEAHPPGTWNLLFQEHVDEHKCLEDRVTAAKRISLNDESMKLYVDTMDDQLNRAFGAFPERLYILLDNKVVYQGGEGPFGHKVEEIEDWIVKNNYV